MGTLAGTDGLTDREIGDRLFLSPRTVSSHLDRSYPKLGVASRHQLRDVITRASTRKRRKADSSLGRFPETTTRVRALEALAPGAGHRAAAADEAPGPASVIRCLLSPPGRVPSREVQSACRYPAATFQTQTQTVRGYPAPDQRRVLGRLRTCRAKGLTREPSTRRPVSAGDRLVAAPPGVRTGADNT
jgi:hypothetical protein